MVGRLVRGRNFSNQRSQVKIEAAVERALGGIAVDRGQHDAGNNEDHHDPRRRGQEQPGGKRTAAHQGMVPNGRHRFSAGIMLESMIPKSGYRFSDKIMLEYESKPAVRSTLDQVPGVGGVSR